MARPILHVLLHLAVPGVVARLGWPRSFWRAWAVMVATMIIDLDHLLADPIYDANRCSIGTHPLHSGWTLAASVLLLLPARTRLVGAGLLIHLGLDGLDCLLL